MIKSPRQKFLASKVRGEWEKITETQAFEQACDYALLQLQEYMPYSSSNPNVPAECHHQICGAMHLIKILKTIHEQEKEITEEKRPSLNYQAGV